MTRPYPPDPCPPATGAGAGERVTAAVPGHGMVEAVLRRDHAEGVAALWRARHTWEVVPATPASSPAELSALLTAVGHRLRAARPESDSACVLTWPSTDLATTPVLLDHGLRPEAVLAIRESTTADAKHGPTPSVRVRRATVADLDEMTALWLEEVRYAALVGSTVVRPDAPALLDHELRRCLRRGDPLWMAESDGVAVGLAVCGWPVSGDTRLPPGRWGHVGVVSVAPTFRGTGVGSALMSVAHDALSPTRRAHGTFLFYSPHNVLSSVFWHRRGYRPLQTIWEVRPATAL